MGETFGPIILLRLSCAKINYSTKMDLIRVIKWLKNWVSKWAKYSID